MNVSFPYSMENLAYNFFYLTSLTKIVFLTTKQTNRPMGVGEERGGGVEQGREGEKETERERRTLENYLKGHIEVITMRDMIHPAGSVDESCLEMCFV